MVNDHGTIPACLPNRPSRSPASRPPVSASTSRVSRTRATPITRHTLRHGKPVAPRVRRQEPAARKKRVLGAYKGRVEIFGDIVSPVLPPEAWEALRK